jgi:hypothetical protein
MAIKMRYSERLRASLCGNDRVRSREYLRAPTLSSTSDQGEIHPSSAPLDAEHVPNFIASLYHGPATPNLDKTILLSTHVHTLPPPFLPNASIGYPSVTTTQSPKKKHTPIQLFATRKSFPSFAAHQKRETFLDSINPEVNKEAIGSRRFRYQPKIEMRAFARWMELQDVLLGGGLLKRWWNNVEEGFFFFG